MIPILGKQPVTILRLVKPTWNKGQAIKPPPVETVVRISVQPADESQLQWLPSGCTAENTIWLFGRYELRVSRDSDYSDRVRRSNGRTYVVISSKRYPTFEGDTEHWESYAVELQPIGSPQGVAP